MSVIIETTLGDITVDLYTERRPRCCINFLKLCKLKYYNFNLFHTVRRGFIAQTGDPSGVGDGGESIWGVLEGDNKKYFQLETNPRIKHSGPGLLSFVGDKNGMLGSQFFLTLGDELGYLDGEHCVFGEVTEGLDLLHKLNEVICDEQGRPYKDIRITHTVILCDPYEDPPNFVEPSSSPLPTADRLLNGRIAADEITDDEADLSATEVAEMRADREAKARATILEMIGDIPDSEVAPPENVLFVCKLNPVTTDQDLEIIFSRFGKIKSCEVIRDKKTGDSLQYAFIEFEDKSSCENAYFKMDNVLIDDRRIHVDFSQSVAKVRWFGKGRIKYENDDSKQDFGKGKYQKTESKKHKHQIENERRNDRGKQNEYNERSRERNAYYRNDYRDDRRSYNQNRYSYSKNRDRRYENEERNIRNYKEDRYRHADHRERNEDRYRHADRRERKRSRSPENRKSTKRRNDSDSENEYKKSKSKNDKHKKRKSKRDRSSSTSSSSSSSSVSSEDSYKKKKSKKKKSKKHKK